MAFMWRLSPPIRRSYVDSALRLTTKQAPFVVVSHGTQEDPIFNYGNAAGGQGRAPSHHQFCVSSWPRLCPARFPALTAARSAPRCPQR